MKSNEANSDPVTAGVQEVRDDLTAGIAEYLGVGPSMANRREYLIFLAASLLVCLGILSLLGYVYLWPWLQPYYAVISDKEKISGLFRAAGDWAPIVYMLLEAAQVLTMVLAGAAGTRRGLSVRTALGAGLLHDRTHHGRGVGLSFGTLAGTDLPQPHYRSREVTEVS